MAFKYFDRIKETTITLGTGTLTLGGAVIGYKTFASRYAVADRLHYCIVGASGWEVGLGTFGAANTLQRTSVIASSNADAFVDFGAGSKDVFVTLPALAGVRTGTAFFSAADAADRDGVPTSTLQQGALCRLRSDGSIWEWSGAVWAFYADGPQGANGWPVQTETSTAKIFSLLDLRLYTTTSNNAAITFTIPAQVDVAWPDSTLLVGDQGALGQITFVGGAGVTIETPETLKTWGQFAPWALKRVAANRWRLCGKLEVA